MPHQRELTYLGDDRLLVALLRAYFPKLKTVWYPELATVPWDHWDRMVMIDAGAESFEMLLALREISAGTPAILLVGPEEYRLTQASVAYHGGAEAVFCKPICRPNQLIACLADCDRRLDHWKTHLGRSNMSAAGAERPLAAARLQEHHQEQLQTIDDLCLRVIGRQLTTTDTARDKRPGGTTQSKVRSTNHNAGTQPARHL